MKKGKGRNSKLLPNSLRIISSCIKTVSTNASTAVRSAGATVAASISSQGDDRKEQVLWAGFDKLELSITSSRRVLLLGYVKGFQVFDVEDASGLSELVSRRDGPVTFLQMLPAGTSSCDGVGKYNSSRPILVVVGGNEDDKITSLQGTGQEPGRYGSTDSSFWNSFDHPSSVRFYSMKSNEYIKVIDFKSAVLMVRCSARIIAVGLEEQIYCFDALTLEKKFIVVTYPVPRVGEHGAHIINAGYGPMAVGPRWLAYPPSRPFFLDKGRLSPKNTISSVGPSSYPGSGTMVARYAVESTKHLAAGFLTLGDMGYKKLSKYYPELLPDSPSSPGWKAGKLAASEPENAGVIAVKDVVCSEVISQFRAHTSPISALCFDPSGTLLVTASVHGNNIHIYRITPFHKCGESGSGDWNTCHVHLYKLYRGITNAVIQDICFNPSSQWIAIISSRGTCHIFILPPYRGDDVIQARHSHGQGTSPPFLASTRPWGSTSSFTVNKHHSLPPPPFTLSVVTRIKCSDTGLLNSVSNAAALMAGKLCVPSGALAAIFHNSGSTDSMEHIFVYTPSGFVVQYEIMSSVGPTEGRTETFPSRQTIRPQNEDLTVKVEASQWWDVCRRSDNMEREDCITGNVFLGPNDPQSIDNNSRKLPHESVNTAEKSLMKTDANKSSDRLHWYLSNAEVRINSGRLPLFWQKSQIHFHVLEPLREERGLGGEFEIEVALSHEIEIRQKDLLPIFDSVPRTRPGLIDGTVTNSYQAKESTNEASIICYSKPPSFSSTESSDGGSSKRMENLLDFDHYAGFDRCSISVNLRTSNLIMERDVNACLKAPLMEQIPKPPLPFCPSNIDCRSTSPGNDNVDHVNSNADAERDETINEGDPRGSTDDIGNTCEEEKVEEEGWIGGMFDFSE